jgi:sulfane dehydrogenase subunit SoxC
VSAAAGNSLAETLADVPAREPGDVLSGRSERSKYVQISRIPEAGPGVRNVDPSDAINSKTPLNKLVGVITPSDLHYERSHAGVPDLDPAKHRLLIHGMAQKTARSDSGRPPGHAVCLSRQLHRVHGQRVGGLEED